MTQQERELRNRLNNLNNKATELNKRYTTLNDDERKTLENSLAETQQIKAQLQNLIELENNKRALDENQPVQPNTKKKFANSAEFLRAVRMAKTSGTVDPRLQNVGQTVGVNEDGGYLVDQDLIVDLMATVYDESVLYNDTTQLSVSSNANGVSIRVPKDGYGSDNSTIPAGVTVYGGAAAYWTEETEAIELSKVGFEKVDLELNKVAAILKTSNEMEQDVGAIGGFIGLSAGRAIAEALDDAIMRGPVAAQNSSRKKPLGILNGGNLRTITPSSATAAISTQDIVNMYAAMRDRDRRNAKWYINQSLESTLMTLTLGDKPIYLPAGSLANTPYATLLGRPVVYTEQASQVGTIGDILFANMREYITINKGGIKAATSIHVEFVTDQTAYRFTMRVDGRPLRDSVWQRSGNKGTFAPFVVLGARAGAFDAPVA